MQEPRQILSGSAKKAMPSAHLMPESRKAETIEITVVLARKTAIPPEDFRQHVLLKPHERPSVDHANFAEPMARARRRSRLFARSQTATRSP